MRNQTVDHLLRYTFNAHNDFIHDFAHWIFCVVSYPELECFHMNG
jgi:hypothetical protein